MATINTIDTEQIQAGLAGLPPIATVDIWSSLDPTVPFSLQNWGISNFQGIHNQNALYNGIGLWNQLGIYNGIGQGSFVGGHSDAQPNYDSSAPKMDFNSVNGNLGGSWTLNGVPVCASFDCSDINLKTNIKPLENCLDKVLKLRGISFDWIEEKIPFYVKYEGIHQVGLIAQEVEEVVPELVVESKIEQNDVKSVRYGHITALLIEAIKEQQEQINSLKETVQELSTKLAECCS